MPRPRGWKEVGTGGGFTALRKDLATGIAPLGWMMTVGEGFAPPDGHDGPVDLWLEDSDGSIPIIARCKSVADAVALSGRFKYHG